MIRFVSIQSGFAIVAFMISLGFSQITPQNSWRALFIYSNAIDSIYSDSLEAGANMYNTYFASYIDGMNQIYEESGVDIRAQLAGVIWDKAYVRETCSTCTVNDLLNAGNGMGRWVNDSILDKYAADVVILVHDPADLFAGGAAFNRPQAISRGYAGFWIRHPNNLLLIAHEIGHVYSTAGNGDHCYSGHRRVVGAFGAELGGPSPNTLSNIVGISGGSPYSVQGIVETVADNAYRGFNTTMAYGTGEGSPTWTYPCYPERSHTYGGVTRTFRFQHQGRGRGPGPNGNDWRSEWTGTYSNPNVAWVDPLTGTAYPTGTSDTIFYINRLKYVGGPEVYRDSTPYLRNFSAVLNANKDVITEFRGIPPNITLNASMSLGQHGADSQWVYAHFAATNAVVIEAGFRVKAGSSMKVTVGGPSGMLAKREANSFNASAETPLEGQGAGLRVKYDAASHTVVFSLNSEAASQSRVSVFDLMGTLKKERVFSWNGGSNTSSLSVRDLPNGIYVMRVAAGKNKFQRQFVKW